MGAERGIRIDKAYTTPAYEVGTEAEVKGKGKFVFGKAASAFAAYVAVRLDSAFLATPITSTVAGAKPSMVGVPQATLASGEYGWFWRQGGGSGSGIKVTVAASCAADAKIGTTATAGVLDDTIGVLVQGLAIVTANGGSQAAVECYSVTPITVNCQD